MRKWNWIIYFSCLVMAGSVAASQVTVDEDYMQVMEDRQKSLTSNIALNNTKAAVEDAKALNEMFSDVETFYAQKGNANDAVNWTKESKGLTVAITKYVATKDFDTASVKAVTLAKTCKECHSVYKKDK
ncbi:MAG TPA: hypothetical protein VFK88_09325 [Gallionella sp.]|nr:hypothetical protein [Gallionella sp.]